MSIKFLLKESPEALQSQFLELVTIVIESML